MCSGEHTHTSLHNGVPWAVDWFCVSSMAWGWNSEVATVIWVLDVTQVIVLVVVVAGNIAIVDSDVAVELWGSGQERGGCRLVWGAGNWPGSDCHHS
jgi:hypothetical protein